MTKPNYRPLVKSYVLSVLADHDHNLENPTDDQLFAYAKDRFFSEYGWQVKRIGLQPAIREWLLGLALNIEYTYYDIGLLLQSWGILKGTETEGQREKALGQYWDRVAVVLASEFEKV
jgi:hypothetical protein